PTLLRRPVRRPRRRPHRDLAPPLRRGLHGRREPLARSRRGSPVRPGGARPAAGVPPVARGRVRPRRPAEAGECLAGPCRHPPAAAAMSGARANQKLRTRKDLLEAAARLMREGRTPTFDEIAEAAMVSRATAYRYFPGLDALLVEAGL